MSCTDPRYLEMVSRMHRELRVRRSEQVAQQQMALAAHRGPSMWKRLADATTQATGRAAVRVRLAAVGDQGYIGWRHPAVRWHRHDRGGGPHAPHPV